MDALNAFSFTHAVQELLPSTDWQESRVDLQSKISSMIKADGVHEDVRILYHQSRETLNRILDTLFLLLQSPNLDTEEETVNSVINSLDELKKTWLLGCGNNVEVYGGYHLNLSCIPTSILFYKHLSDTHYIHRNHRVTRASFENEYKVWSGRNDLSYKFSHILFALSWLCFLRVHNNSTILLNTRPPISV